MIIFVFLLFATIQFAFCYCKFRPLKFAPLLLVAGLYYWIDRWVVRDPNPEAGCGLGEWLASSLKTGSIVIGLVGIAAGWLLHHYWTHELK